MATLLRKESTEQILSIFNKQNKQKKRKGTLITLKKNKYIEGHTYTNGFPKRYGDSFYRKEKVIESISKKI